MYKVTSKKGSIFFKTIEDALDYIENNSLKLFEKGFVKISFMEEF